MYIHNQYVFFSGRPKKTAKYKVGQTFGFKLPPATLYIDKD